MIKEIVKREVDKMGSDELVLISNSISDMDLSTFDAFHIYSMKDFDKYCHNKGIEFTDLIEYLGKEYRFDLTDKYFVSHEGMCQADDLHSFTNFYDYCPKCDFIEWLSDEIINSISFEPEDIIKNAIDTIKREGSI